MLLNVFKHRVDFMWKSENENPFQLLKTANTYLKSKIIIT